MFCFIYKIHFKYKYVLHYLVTNRAFRISTLLPALLHRIKHVLSSSTSPIGKWVTPILGGECPFCHFCSTVSKFRRILDIKYNKSSAGVPYWLPHNKFGQVGLEQPQSDNLHPWKDMEDNWLASSGPRTVEQNPHDSPRHPHDSLALKFHCYRFCILKK